MALIGLAILFFRLVTRRYEHASPILTSNKGFANWGKVLGVTVIATAILDRLLHHATTITININIIGESYRLKDSINPETHGGSDHLKAKEMTP